MAEITKSKLTQNQEDILLALNRDGHKTYKTQEIEQVFVSICKRMKTIRLFD